MLCLQNEIVIIDVHVRDAASSGFFADYIREKNVPAANPAGGMTGEMVGGAGGGSIGQALEIFR